MTIAGPRLPATTSNLGPSTDSSDMDSTSETPNLHPTTAASCATSLTIASSANQRGRPPVFLRDHRDEKRGNAWYDDYPTDMKMSIKTVKLGLWATNKELDQLWESIEFEMDARQVLFRHTSKIKGKGTQAALQAEKLKAVEAGIDGIEHFKNMMSVISCHQGYKDSMLRALRYHCLQRCYFRRRNSETPAPAARRGRRMTTGTPRHASAPTCTKRLPLEPQATEREFSDMALGSQRISIGLDGVEDMVTYLPLHLVPEHKGLRKLNLPSDEMKARLQPEDLSFELLKRLVCQDCKIEGWILVTCPELDEDIVNERNFQVAVDSLVKAESELRFMVSNSELVSLKILARWLCLRELTLPKLAGDATIGFWIGVVKWKVHSLDEHDL